MTKLEIRLEDMQKESDLAEWKVERVVALVQDIADHARAFEGEVVLPEVQVVSVRFSRANRAVYVSPLSDLTYKWTFALNVEGTALDDVVGEAEGLLSPKLLDAVQLFLTSEEPARLGMSRAVQIALEELGSLSQHADS